MMLVDSSVWIDFLKRQPFIFTTLQMLLERQSVVAAGCVFGEPLKGAKNSRERNIIFEYWDNLPKRTEDGLWVEAGLLSSHQKWLSKGVGLIDAFLVCLAQTYQLQLWTLDKKLLSVLSPTAVFTPTSPM